MNRWGILAHILIATVFITLPKFQSSAQEGDCGNGLIQRLEVGERGWIDPAPPAQGVRMRQAPGEAEVARLQPGEEFTVLDGPQCFDTYSWFEVETNSGKRGWIAEGVEAGEYFVDPLAEVELEVDLESCSGDPSSFQVGQYVNLIESPTIAEWFYGHPLVDGAYFSFDTFFLNEYVLADSPDHYLDNMGNLTADYLITKGPVCVNGHYMWEIRTGVMWFWLDESFLTLSDYDLPTEPVFLPKIVNLTEPPSLLVSPELQIAWDNAGGGGDGGTLQLVNDGCQIDVGQLIRTYEEACIAIYPFASDEVIDIQIKQTDGTVIYATTQNPETLELGITADVPHEIQVQGIQVYVPTKLGVTSGIYTIEARTASSIQNVSYIFQEDYSRDWGEDNSSTSVLTSFCDADEPILVASNLNPLQEIDLVFVKETEFVDNVGSGTVTFEETYRWDILTGEHGEFVANIELDLPEGYFVIARDNGNWESNFPRKLTSFGDFAPLATRLRSDCTNPQSHIQRNSTNHIHGHFLVMKDK